MFPIKLTLTVSTVDQLNRLTALVSEGYAAAVADAPKLASLNTRVIVDENGKTVAVQGISSRQHDPKDDQFERINEEVAAAPAPLPKKAKPTPAATPVAAAPSQPTAEVVEAAAPVKTAAESAPAAPSAATAPAPSTAATEAFPYSKLQALVFKHLPAHGAKLLEVSAKHGAAKFKELPADKWADAYADLVAAYGE